jgi:hypothetical protein
VTHRTDSTALKRKVDLFDLRVTAHTSLSAATADYMRGIAFLSTGEGRLGTPLQSRTCSTHSCTFSTICLPCGESSRREGCDSQT